MKRISTAKIAAVLLVTTSILHSASAYAECSALCDEIIVYGDQPSFGASFWLMNIFYTGGVGGGGSGPFLQEAAFFGRTSRGVCRLDRAAKTSHRPQ